MTKVSILIPTLNEPFSKRVLNRLMETLSPQLERYKGVVDHHINSDGRHVTIGEKRNRMIADSSSEYFCFIDCDDMITPDYLDEIMKGLESNPDVVTMCGWMTTDKVNRREWTIRLGSDYVERDKHYYRFPNHLTVMKRKLVEHVKFPHIKQQEDFRWASMIHNAKLLKTEYHIAKQIYWYDFVSPHKRV